jgi:hypothetical protein
MLNMLYKFWNDLFKATVPEVEPITDPREASDEQPRRRRTDLPRRSRRNTNTKSKTPTS